MTEASPLRRVTLVLGASTGGMGTHARTLAAGLANRGIAVSVAGPHSVDARFSFSALPTVSFSPVEILGRPRAGDIAGILRVRRLLLRPAHSTSQALESAPHRHQRDGGQAGRHVAHAHGLRAGALTVLALLLARRSQRPAVVVTVHNAPQNAGPARTVYRLLERVVALGADLVLCVSPDLERRMHAAGARHVARAVIAAPRAASRPAVASSPSTHGSPSADPSQAILPAGRPVVLAVGRLAPQKGFDVLLKAAAGWGDLDPVPLVAIAGDGPLAAELREQAAKLGVDALFLGHRNDVPALLAAAAVFVLPSQWEGQPLVLQEALRAGTPVVATRVGGIPSLTGEDAALLIPERDQRALAAAVRSVLAGPSLAGRLRAAAAARAATLPSEADAVTAALSAYASVTRGPSLR
jgi:glycosyltransferase involved in cell wall biosynthesis